MKHQVLDWMILADKNGEDDKEETDSKSKIELVIKR